MRKKSLFWALVSSAFVLPLLSSCGEKITPIAQTFGALFDSSLSDTDHFKALVAHSDLQALVDKASPFVLVVLPKDLGCTCWSDFCATINRYQKNKNLLIYSVGANQFDDASVSKFGLNIDAHLATIAIFDGSTFKYQQTADGVSDSFAKDYDVFASWMNARLGFSFMLYVNKNQLEALYSGTTPFTIGFERSSCPDCSYVDSNFLKSYNQIEHNLSYVVDCDVEGIRYYNGAAPSNKTTASDDEKQAYSQWATFKDNYGLSETFTATFGFDAGYVPTWLHCNPAANEESKPWGAIDDADVYVNDTVTLVEGSYKVTSSFFDGARDLPFLSDSAALAKGGCTVTTLVGLTLTEDDVDIRSYNGVDYCSWKHESAAKYHDPLLKSFLEKYVAMK